MGKKSKTTPQPAQVKFQNVLSIETSCDDTSVAIVSATGFVRAMKTISQDEIHGPHGGIIPELASRNHTMRLLPLIDELAMPWKNISGICVTSRPGLLGSLLVGVTVAKALSLMHGIPILGVNHLEGHLYAPFLQDAGFDNRASFEEPFVGLCVSGGHTSLVHVKEFGKYVVIGRTLDDAAGEAFDKFGKVLGLGYPAGKVVDEKALDGNPQAFDFPRPLLKKPGLDFSFSGLKTAGSLEIKRQMTLAGVTDPRQLPTSLVNDFCASFQEAVVEVLIDKLAKAMKKLGLKRAVITGGVSCNSRLRSEVEKLSTKLGYEILKAPLRYCTDNAAMIGFVGAQRFQRGQKGDLNLTALASSKNAEII